MSASRFVPKVRASIMKYLGRGWTDIDSVMVHYGTKAIFAIEFKAKRDLVARFDRDKFAWQRQVYVRAFAETTIVIGVVCDEEEFTFEIQAWNDAAHDWLGAESVAYQDKPFAYEELAKRIRRLLGD